MILRIRFWLSLLCALALMVLPFPYVWQWFMPDWCLLVLFAWYLIKTDLVPMGLAWLLGLILDALTGSLLGIHALGYLLAWYLFSLFSVRILLFPMRQKVLIMAIVALLNVLVVECAQACFSKVEISWYRLYSVFFTALCWPLVLILVNKLVVRRSRSAWGNW